MGQEIFSDSFIFRTESAIWFGKNTHSPPSVAQALSFTPLSRGQTLARHGTFIELEGADTRLSHFASGSVGGWGAQMGVNQHGVVVGCHLAGTKLAGRGKPGVSGGDLVRLALEQARSSRDARDIITRAVERYGQGASLRLPALNGYDSSFIIADFHEAWELETAGTWWAARRVPGYAARSDCMEIGETFDLAASGAEDYARDKHWAPAGEPFHFSGAFARRWPGAPSSARRRQQTMAAGLKALSGLAAPDQNHFMVLLGRHAGQAPGRRGDICVHGRGERARTAASMLVKVGFSGLPRVWYSEGQPCSGEFRELLFKT
ncbi:hypothetical protein FV139_20875 [Parahaliea maris]|uniref:Dipeptidase n=1 Tax=Parahaliea maris TaxID=2716870 RepID=A0A5C8ZME1_9GAMM|nr:C69 family dipeptidase [Parahaliea maris]TXS88932.1 hypothetical protein FV139_20875 [Parahaliea maris]